MTEQERDKLINERLGFKDNLERAKHNLYLRDKFLVEKGLWAEFVDQLPKSDMPT